MSKSFVSPMGYWDLNDVDLEFTVNGVEHTPTKIPDDKEEKP